MTKSSQLSSNFQRESNYEQEASGIIDMILILAKQIKIIILVPTFVCFFTIIYALFFTQPVYTSTSKIMSSSSGGDGVSQAVGLAAQFGINIPTSQSEPKWTYPEIMKSRTVAREVLKRKFDSNKFGKNKTLLQILTYGNQKPEVGIDTLEIKAVDNFLQIISISEDIVTGILTLSVKSSEPKLAADINRVIIEELDSHQSRYNKAKISETRTFIEERIIDTEKELMMAEENLKVFRDRNRRIENSPALQLEQQRLSREVSVLTGVYTTLKQQLETTKIEEVKVSDYVIILDPPETPLIRSEPNRKRMVIIAGIFGIGLGVLLAFFREYSENRNKEEKDKMDEAKSMVLKKLSELIRLNLKY
tara:strand:+ start:2598 stop:3683 length:1086 start_codon:yes stop_codon:yes gene_type:complete